MHEHFKLDDRLTKAKLSLVEAESSLRYAYGTPETNVWIRDGLEHLYLALTQLTAVVQSLEARLNNSSIPE